MTAKTQEPVWDRVEVQKALKRAQWRITTCLTDPTAQADLTSLRQGVLTCFDVLIDELERTTR